MKVGDLVKLDVPGQRVHGKIGVIVEKTEKSTYSWLLDHMGQPAKSFNYEVMVGSEVWRVGELEIIGEEDWESDVAL